jgi:hypothetical protein
MNDNDSNSNNDKSAINVNTFSTTNSGSSGSSSTGSGSSGSSTSGSSGSFNYMNSWRQQITGMMDDQRLHRLQQCRILQTVLSDCRKSNDSNNISHRQRKIELEDVPAGIRMVRYFNWRDWKEPSGASDTDNDTNDSNSNSNNSNHCLREEHAVWACRSVALKCGAPLAQLRSCFTDAGADAVLDSRNRTAYEPDDAGGADQTPKTQCQWQQQALGDCVAAAAVQLQERQESSKASTSTSTPGC